MDQILVSINAHMLGWLAALVVLHNFLNNLAANIPALKGNTWFQCLAGALNAVVETSQGKQNAPEKPESPN